MPSVASSVSFIVQRLTWQLALLIAHLIQTKTSKAPPAFQYMYLSKDIELSLVACPDSYPVLVQLDSHSAMQRSL